MLRFVVVCVELAGDLLAETSNDCGLELGKRAPENDRVNFLGLIKPELITAPHMILEQSQCLPWPCRPAKQTMRRQAFMECLLVWVGFVVVGKAFHAIAGRGDLRAVGFRTRRSGL